MRYIAEIIGIYVGPPRTDKHSAIADLSRN